VPEKIGTPPTDMPTTDLTSPFLRDERFGGDLGQSYRQNYSS